MEDKQIIMDEKGALTIPHDVRAELGLIHETTLDISVQRGQIVLGRATPAPVDDPLNGDTALFRCIDILIDDVSAPATEKNG